MAVNGVGNYNYVNKYDTHHKAKGEKVDEKATTAAASETAAETEEASENTSSQTTSVTQKAETYKPDMDKIREMKANLKGNMDAFKKMVYGQIKSQGNQADNSLSNMLKGIAGISQEDAAKAVAEDGEWGVTATANRILDFAVALSGGDPEKISLLKDAVNKGFAAAGKVWGGDLPDISKQTLTKVMEGFDEWEKAGSSANIGSNKKVDAE